MENEMITIIAVEPGKKPYVAEIPHTLESLQKEVGGDIQAIYPYEDPLAIIAAESGKLMGMPFNRALRDEDGHIYDVLVGKFLIVGLGEDNFTSMPEELAQKYMAKFQTPEMMIQMNGKNCIVRMELPKNTSEKKPSIMDRLNEPKPKTPSVPKKPKSKGPEL